MGLAAEKFLSRVLKRCTRDRAGFKSKGCSAQVHNGTSRPAGPGPVLVERACVKLVRRQRGTSLKQRCLVWRGGTCGRQGVAQRISFTLILR